MSTTIQFPNKDNVANNTLGKGNFLDIMSGYNKHLLLIIAAPKAVSRTV